MATRYSVSNNGWSSVATWSATSGGTSGASVPTIADDVVIENSKSVSVLDDAECASLTMTGPLGGIQIDDGITLTVAGAVVITLDGEGDEAGISAFDGTSATLIVGGNISLLSSQDARPILGSPFGNLVIQFSGGSGGGGGGGLIGG